jgi:hypothetical protein
MLDWELGANQPTDWDEGARPHLEAFLALHTPYAALEAFLALHTGGAPEGVELVLALSRRGKPTWAEEDFKHLLYTLGCAGYGWLRPEGVRRELENTKEVSDVNIVDITRQRHYIIPILYVLLCVGTVAIAHLAFKLFLSIDNIPFGPLLVPITITYIFLFVVGIWIICIDSLYFETVSLTMETRWGHVHYSLHDLPAESRQFVLPLISNWGQKTLSHAPASDAANTSPPMMRKG